MKSNNYKITLTSSTLATMRVEPSLSGVTVSGWIHSNDGEAGRAACKTVGQVLGCESVGGTSLDGFLTIAFEKVVVVGAVRIGGRKTGPLRIETREELQAKVEKMIVAKGGRLVG